MNEIPSKISTVPENRLMTVVLPDNSSASLDKETLRFYSIDPARPQEVHDARTAVPLFRTTENIDFQLLAGYLEKPHLRFGDCFRRTSDDPMYSPKGAADFSLLSLAHIYRFPDAYQGGTFCSSHREWTFLDGGLINHHGYGWGSSSWSAVYGAEALRALCMFYGIQQPQRIKGEPPRRPLSVLLEEMTSLPRA